MNSYIILKGVLLPNTWASQQQKYLKYGGRKPVASKKMTLGQVALNFTGQVVSSPKYCEFLDENCNFMLCFIVKITLRQKNLEISWRFQAVLLCLN